MPDFFVAAHRLSVTLLRVAPMWTEVVFELLRLDGVS
jgi:hypothetical protein